MKILLQIALLVLLYSASVLAHTVFYTDLTSGPNTGGESSRGTILTINGKGFAVSQGTSKVFIGGGEVGHYYSWSDTEVVVGIGANAVTGTINVKLNNTTDSLCAGQDGDNPTCLFTVRSGTGSNLYFVSSSGNDTTGTGSFATPWRTLFKARSMAVAGDTVYAMSGSDQLCRTDSGTSVVFKVGSGKGVTGTVGKPISFVVYPAATVQIGTSDKVGDGCSDATNQYAIYLDTNFNYWTFAGFTIRNYASAAGTSQQGGPVKADSTNIRWINNDMSAPFATYTGIQPGRSYAYMYGNYIHDGGSLLNNGTWNKNLHQVYSQTDHLWIGWNTFDNNYGCRHIQIGQDNVHGFYDIHIFSNLFSDDNCEAINLENIDPSLGTVEVYNNVIWHTGTNAQGVGGSYSGIRVSDYDTGTCDCPGSGTVEIYNNTIYDAGSYVSAGTSGGAINKGSNLNIDVRLRNNINQQLFSESYVCSAAHDCTIDTGDSTRLTHIIGDSNMWYGSSAPIPTQTTGNLVGGIATNPLFTSIVTPDFTLQATSPAKNGGVTIASASPDINGVPRPTNTTYALGAYEVACGSASKLAFTQQPSSAQFNVSVSPAVTVQVQDANGCPITTSTASIAIAIGTNPSAGTLSGTTPVSAIAGTASFSNLSLNNPGIGYTLAASSGGLTGVTSNTFNITGTLTTSFTISSTTPSPGGVASATVTAKKVDGTTDTAYNGTVSITSSDGSASLPANHTYVGGDAGVYVFSVVLRTAGCQTITATDSVNAINSTSGCVTVARVSSF